MHIKYRFNNQIRDAKVTQLISVTATPEPSTFILLGSTIFGMFLIKKKNSFITYHSTQTPKPAASLHVSELVSFLFAG